MRTTFPRIALIAWLLFSCGGSLELGQASAARFSSLGSITAPTSSGIAAIRATARLARATLINDTNQNRIFDSLEVQLAAEPPGKHQKVIVMFQHGTAVEQALRSIRRVVGDFDPIHVYRAIGGFAAHLNASQVHAIARVSMVRQIELAQPGYFNLDTATHNLGVDAVQDVLGINGDRDGRINRFTAKDVVIAIMDSGFDGRHVDLSGKFLTFLDWASSEGKVKEPYDTQIHGTHVASIAGGLGVGQSRFRGVAPGASFVGFQIADEAGGAPLKESVLASIDWMLRHRKSFPVSIATISAGFGTTTDGTDALELGFDQLFEAGILPFSAAGNAGPDRGTIDIPAGARGVIAAGSLHDPQVSEEEGSSIDSSFYLAEYSSRGPIADGRLKPDLVAPGDQIMAAKADSRDGYFAGSGTSMAAPFSAGVAALLLDANPRLTNIQVRKILFETVEDWGPEGHDADFGRGRIDALAAVTKALRAAGRPAGARPPELPSHITTTLETQQQPGSAQARFRVEKATEPLSITVIIQDMAVTANPTALNRADRRISVELEEPGQPPEQLWLPPATTTPRQFIFNIPTPKKGIYTLRVHNLGADDELSIDLSGAVRTLVPSRTHLVEML